MTASAVEAPRPVSSPGASGPPRKIPFFVAGQRYAPGGDHQTLQLAAGPSVWLPKLDDEMVDAALAVDRFLLRNLPLHEIVSFLNNVGQNWKSREYSRRRIYIRQLVDCLGYSEKMAEHEADWIAMILCSHFRLYDMVACELGHRYMLDRWVLTDEAEVRAFPLGRVLHVLSGNVPLAGLASIVRALITKNVCVVKASSLDPISPFALVQSFQDVDSEHPLVRALSVVHWRGGEDSAPQRRLMADANAVCVWGGRDAIDWAVRHAPPDAEMLRFGPKRSLGVIGRGADIEKAARGLAHDVCLYDQRACFSVQQAFVERPLLDAFVVALERALKLYEEMYPKGFHDFDEQAGQSINRVEAFFLGADLRVAASPQGWTIIVGPPTIIDAHPFGRTIFLHPVDSVHEVARHVDEDVQTVAVSPWSLAAEIRDACAFAGASRIVDLGMNNVFRVGSAHDGMFPLHRLVRFASTDLPGETHIKGITVRIDQTKFLQENIFLNYVP